MIARFLVLLLILPLVLREAAGCPWCQKLGIKETVSAGTPDPGGKFHGEVPPAEKTRHYYIAAEPVTWSWVPLGKDPGKSLPLPPPLVKNPVSAKVRYVEYTDATFTQRVLEVPRLGLTGPVLRGVTGEYLAVTFLNKGPQPLSMHPHGVSYDKDSEGAYYEPGPGKGAAVGPGATFTYIWHLDALSGPQPGEPSSKCWLYHSHAAGEEELNFGLAGFIIVTDPARARPDGTPSDVDREMATLFFMFDEAPEDEALEYANADLPTPPEPRPLITTLELQEAGVRPAINGLMFGNHPVLEMREGERVRWYLGGLGEENGMHTVHWHGARVREEGRRVTDVITLLPGETKIADQLAENPGTWQFHCHVGDHMMEGMFANFTVLPKSGVAPSVPFLSAVKERASLRWLEAEVDTAADPPVAKLRGVVSAYRGYFLRRTLPVVTVAGRTARLQFAPPDEARADGAVWKAIGLSPQGVLRADNMEFTLTLTGPAWRDALLAAGLPAAEAPEPAKTPAVEIPVEVTLGNATHRAPLRLRTNGPRATLDQ
jgi:hypothetical protein